MIVIKCSHGTSQWSKKPSSLLLQQRVEAWKILRVKSHVEIHDAVLIKVLNGLWKAKNRDQEDTTIVIMAEIESQFTFRSRFYYIAEHACEMAIDFLKREGIVDCRTDPEFNLGDCRPKVAQMSVYAWNIKGIVQEHITRLRWEETERQAKKDLRPRLVRRQFATP